MQFAVKLCRGRKHSKNRREYGKCIRETYASNAVVYVTFLLISFYFSNETLHANTECIMFRELKSTFPFVLYCLTYEYTQTHSLSPHSSTLIPAAHQSKIKPNWADGLKQIVTRNTNHKHSRQHPQQPEGTLNSIKFSGFCATAIGIFDLPANMP